MNFMRATAIWPLVIHIELLDTTLTVTANGSSDRRQLKKKHTELLRSVYRQTIDPSGRNDFDCYFNLRNRSVKKMFDSKNVHASPSNLFTVFFAVPHQQIGTKWVRCLPRYINQGKKNTSTDVNTNNNGICPRNRTRTPNTGGGPAIDGYDVDSWGGILLTAQTITGSKCCMRRGCNSLERCIVIRFRWVRRLSLDSATDNFQMKTYYKWGLLRLESGKTLHSFENN